MCKGVREGKEGRLEREKAAGYGDVCLFLVFFLSLSKLLLIWLSHSDLSSFFWVACGVGVGHSLRAMAFFAFCQFEELGLGGEGGREEEAWRALVFFRVYTLVLRGVNAMGKLYEYHVGFYDIFVPCYVLRLLEYSDFLE